MYLYMNASHRYISQKNVILLSSESVPTKSMRGFHVTSLFLWEHLPFKRSVFFFFLSFFFLFEMHNFKLSLNKCDM